MQVHVDVVVIESDDVATAIAEEVAKNAITKLVIGASSYGIFSRYLLELLIYNVMMLRVLDDFLVSKYG